MKTLTETQAKVLSFIKAQIKKNGYSPTMQDVSDHFKWSSRNAAAEVIWRLTDLGYLEKTVRGYRPVKQRRKC